MKRFEVTRKSAVSCSMPLPLGNHTSVVPSHRHISVMKFLSRPSDKKLHTEGKKRCDGFYMKKEGFQNISCSIFLWQSTVKCPAVEARSKRSLRVLCITMAVFYVWWLLDVEGWNLFARFLFHLATNVCFSVNTPMRE